jgi:SAM-dependent methyltransferase
MNVVSIPARSSFDLTDEGQARLAKEHEARGLEDCYVYHWFDLPDGRTVPGIYDLRLGWRKYLGNVDFSGRRVLEVGPASGFLTFKMEAAGADVVTFDVAPGVSPDIMPCKNHAAVERLFAINARSVRAAWWYFHREFSSKSRAIYGDIYHMPQDIGTFDTSVIGSVLLHLANPLAALTEIARLTTETMIVSDLYLRRMWNPFGAATMEINPHKGRCGPMAWWRISPKAVEHMLHANGFDVESVTYHSHNNHEKGDPKISRRLRFYTIVAKRVT